MGQATILFYFQMPALKEMVHRSFLLIAKVGKDYSKSVVNESIQSQKSNFRGPACLNWRSNIVGRRPNWKKRFAALRTELELLRSNGEADREDILREIALDRQRIARLEPPEQSRSKRLPNLPICRGSRNIWEKFIPGTPPALQRSGVSRRFTRPCKSIRKETGSPKIRNQKKCQPITNPESSSKKEGCYLIKVRDDAIARQ